MKIFSLIISIFLALQVSGQEISFFKAMQSQDINRVIDLLDRRIEVCIEDTQDQYSKREAIRVVQNWIREVEPKTIEPLHGGRSGDNSSHYQVAKMVTAKGNFRVFVYIEEGTGDPKIKKIQIDRF
ncbi:MAG: DUF4783 domain-containing protein [Saprospiraceae bacterium]|nr:DUF4783 domain-containing protein [Saprospiraceae bacterium]